MPNFIRKRLRRRIPNPQRGRRKAARTAALIIAGQQLLARSDYDRISVAQFASHARCSIGTFYGRFRDKNVFIDRLIQWTFNNETVNADRELNAERWQSESSSTIVIHLLRYYVTAMTDQTAGVMRAALKRGQMESRALTPFLSYRAAVTEHAVKLLARRQQKSRHSKADIRTAMQIIHATVIDASLNDLGPLKTGSESMIATLSGLLIQFLDIGDKTEVATQKDRRQLSQTTKQRLPTSAQGRRALRAI